ncbi:MAG: hypothetical protein ACI3W8_05340 [Oscillospiraceae bacterium]
MMELHEAYNEVKKRLDAIDFSALWAGFYPLKFALYNDTDCYFNGRYIDKTSDFLANTSIRYHGEYIAIWNLSAETDDIDRLAASIVHEMFHAFQNIRGESRWANEINALFNYKYSAENISLKLGEAALMEDILTKNNISAFAELLALRKMRSELYPQEYDYEARIEQIEGSANYVELNALAQIDPKKAELQWRKILAVINDPNAYTPVRIVSYYVGAAFLNCIQRCSRFNYNDFSADTFAQKIIENVTPAEREYPVNTEVVKCVKEFYDNTNKIIQTALSKNEVVLSGEYPLRGLNIWDARSDGKYAISNFFISYLDGAEAKALYGDFVVEIDKDYIIHTAYYQ